jgi:hypothetical protein
MEFKELLEKFMTTDNKEVVTGNNTNSSTVNSINNKVSYNHRSIFETKLAVNNPLNRKNRSTLKP